VTTTAQASTTGPSPAAPLLRAGLVAATIVVPALARRLP